MKPIKKPKGVKAAPTTQQRPSTMGKSAGFRQDIYKRRAAATRDGIAVGGKAGRMAGMADRMQKLIGGVRQPGRPRPNSRPGAGKPNIKSAQMMKQSAGKSIKKVLGGTNKAQNSANLKSAQMKMKMAEKVTKGVLNKPRRKVK